jgi:hypothetical protein
VTFPSDEAAILLAAHRGADTGDAHGSSSGGVLVPVPL